MKIGDKDWPWPGSVWQHHNGNKYMVEMVANYNEGETPRNDKYPPMVVYSNIDNLNTYTRRLDDWHRSMTKVED